MEMTTQRPTTPGWYWYELPGFWTLQPVFVFDDGEDELFYTLKAVDAQETDEERDGLPLALAHEKTLWSLSPISSCPQEDRQTDLLILLNKAGLIYMPKGVAGAAAKAMACRGLLHDKSKLLEAITTTHYGRSVLLRERWIGERTLAQICWWAVYGDEKSGGQA